MQIVVFGIGGIGGYFGGKLAKTGNKVTFVARGKHLKAIKENGLQVKSIYGDFLAVPTLATDTTEEIDIPDLIIICTKSWQLVDVAKSIKPLLGEHTLVLPLQNGADNIDKLLSVIDKKHVLGGLCKIISFVESPGVVNHVGFHPQVIIGELNNEKSERINAIKEVFDMAEFDNGIADDIYVDIWRKFLFINTISGIGALTRSPIGVMRSDPFIRNMMEQTANEVLQVANAKGIRLSQNDVDNVFILIDRQDPDITASAQRDIMEGKPSELEDFNGYIAKEGRKLGVKTPANEFIYHCLLPMERKARGL